MLPPRPTNDGDNELFDLVWFGVIDPSNSVRDTRVSGGDVLPATTASPAATAPASDYGGRTDAHSQPVPASELCRGGVLRGGESERPGVAIPDRQSAYQRVVRSRSNVQIVWKERTSFNG